MGKARKEDDGKLRFDLVPVAPLEEAVAALTSGAIKYSDYNYLGLAWGRMFGAAMRHCWAWWRGEEFDPETNISHLGHAIAGLLMLRHSQLRNAGIDDRDVANDSRSKGKR